MMGRSPCCDAAGLKRGPWTTQEDQKLLSYIQKHGHGSWRSLPEKAGLQRCGKSCRLRWTNYLRPDIKRGNFNKQEEQTIIRLHALLGNRWSAIATHLPKRTDNEIKNYWNTHLKKRLAKMGLDSVTHKPKGATLGSAHAYSSNNATNLIHMAQWESTRLEPEARLKPCQHQPGLSRSTSSSAKLLNKMATTLAPPRCIGILKAWQGVLSRSTQEGGGVSTIDMSCNVESTTPTLSMENALSMPAIELSESSTASLGSFGGESVEAWGTKEADFNDWLTNFLLDDEQNYSSVGGMDCSDIGGGSESEALFEGNENYWGDIFDLVNCGESNSPVF